MNIRNVKRVEIFIINLKQEPYVGHSEEFASLLFNTIDLSRLVRFHYADFATKSPTQIMKVRDANHVADFRDLCLRLPR